MVFKLLRWESAAFPRGEPQKNWKQKGRKSHLHGLRSLSCWQELLVRLGRLGSILRWLWDSVWNAGLKKRLGSLPRPLCKGVICTEIPVLWELVASDPTPWRAMKLSSSPFHLSMLHRGLLVSPPTTPAAGSRRQGTEWRWKSHNA